MLWYFKIVSAQKRYFVQKASILKSASPQLFVMKDIRIIYFCKNKYS